MFQMVLASLSWFLGIGGFVFVEGTLVGQV